jgi:hypothetical protein
MIEYCVVVTFGVLTLTTGPMKSLIFELTDTIQNNFQGYSYAISLSDTPDHTNSVDLETMLITQGVPDDQAAYLSQNPFALSEDLEDFPTSVPDFASAVDDILDAVGLSPSDFLEGLSPF